MNDGEKIVRRITFALLTGVMMFLTGCASNPATHSYRLGYQDGSQGNYRESSTATFNKTRYQLGWQRGVKVYCTTQNAKRLGMEGRMYHNVCPQHQLAAFDHAWREGLRSFCVPQNAYRLGLNGKAFSDFCAPDLNAAFHRAYRRGALHYQQLSGVMDQLNKVNRVLAHVEREHKEAQRYLHAMRLQYLQQSFSPEKQYRIQKTRLKLKRLMEKENVLKTEQNKYKTQYNALKKTFLNMD